jgi:hypothetical protein
VFSWQFQTCLNVVDIYRNYFAKFINITSSFPTIPGASNIYITELIDINGNRLSLNQNQYALDVAYNFTKDTGVNIYYFTNITGSALISSASVIDGGAYYQTILFSTGSLNNFNTKNFEIIEKNGKRYKKLINTILFETFPEEVVTNLSFMSYCYYDFNNSNEKDIFGKINIIKFFCNKNCVN